jgi:hypothetical protein
VMSEGYENALLLVTKTIDKGLQMSRMLLLFLNRTALLIRPLSIVVARRAVATHKIDRIARTGGPATDRGRSPPDHLRVMTMSHIATPQERGDLITARAERHSKRPLR